MTKLQASAWPWSITKAVGIWAELNSALESPGPIHGDHRCLVQFAGSTSQAGHRFNSFLLDRWQASSQEDGAALSARGPKRSELNQEEEDRVR